MQNYNNYVRNVYLCMKNRAYSETNAPFSFHIQGIRRLRQDVHADRGIHPAAAHGRRRRVPPHAGSDVHQQGHGRDEEPHHRDPLRTGTLAAGQRQVPTCHHGEALGDGHADGREGNQGAFGRRAVCHTARLYQLQGRDHRLLLPDSDEEHGTRTWAQRQPAGGD